jgi:hypothetical protein
MGPGVDARTVLPSVRGGDIIAPPRSALASEIEDHAESSNLAKGDSDYIPGVSSKGRSNKGKGKLDVSSKPKGKGVNESVSAHPKVSRKRKGSTFPPQDFGTPETSAMAFKPAASSRSISATPGPMHQTTGQVAPTRGGGRGRRAPRPENSEGNRNRCCHQCRRTNAYDKMQCSKCTKVYCQPCIEKR